MAIKLDMTRWYHLNNGHPIQNAPVKLDNQHFAAIANPDDQPGTSQANYYGRKTNNKTLFKDVENNRVLGKVGTHNIVHLFDHVVLSKIFMDAGFYDRGCLLYRR